MKHLHREPSGKKRVTSRQEQWQLAGDGPESYERFQVPSIFAPLARLFLDAVSLRPGERVLDVACGTGIVTRLAAPLVGHTGRVVGVDLNPGMLAVAALDEATRQALIKTISETLQPYQDAAGLAIPQVTHIAVAYK